VAVAAPGITFQRLDGRQAGWHVDELQDVHREVYGEADQEASSAGQLRVWRRQPGFVLAEARHGDYLVGFATGMPLRTSTSWWKDLTAPLPAEVTTEHPGRTFALTELLVRAPWRRQGIAGSLHDLILDGRPEERATLAVLPGAIAAQKAFRKWAGAGSHGPAGLRTAHLCWTCWSSPPQHVTASGSSRSFGNGCTNGR
jgi:GNAT superfamily N-acetyltransferase